MLDPIAIYSTVFSNAWPIFLLIIVILFFKSPFMKGKIGEVIVNSINSATLDETIYIPIKNVTLSLKDGSTTQIDHILVSKYGLFVIETKNMKGWIGGGEDQKEWTQQIFKDKYRLQNPLRQNYRHIKALEEILEVPPTALTSVIAFVGECTFKTTMPENVFRGISYTKYIKSFDQERLNPLQIRQILSKLQRKQLEQSFTTDRTHVQNLKERMEQPVVSSTAAMTCSRCGSTMVLRQNKKNGEEFYGCSNYPKCKHTAPIV
ncbi:MAG: NERD domain-containing protein [Sulfuricurvum sp.]|uniref:NERD domain-containing protein n=1 Tax=Sulfuricurvum sp. TaxID=2025608 RepID=UPI002624F71C|nr:NERD domain-containing protein [Sulfuricurvum sp.]MDD2830377.1 NERD domain-containing protein [Sulfuricurvum sp.]